MFYGSRTIVVRIGNFCSGVLLMIYQLVWGKVVLMNNTHYSLLFMASNLSLIVMARLTMAGNNKIGGRVQFFPFFFKAQARRYT